MHDTVDEARNTIEEKVLALASRKAALFVLLARAVDDETLVRKVSPDPDIADAIVASMQSRPSRS